MGLIIHIDGGARGNPGPAGAGVLIERDDGSPVHEAGYFIGRHTNNTAEYTALVYALRRAVKTDEDTLTIYSDSELLVQQMTGEYRVKNENLSRLNAEAQKLLLKIDSWKIKHIRREQNHRADLLVNMAIDQRRDVILFDIDGAPDPAASASPESGAAAAASRPSAGAAPPANPANAPAANPSPKPANQGHHADEHHAIRVVVANPPAAEICPAGGCGFTDAQFGNRLPANICLHAAHSLLPTVLAVKNTEPHEFVAIPTLTVRCIFPTCGASFHLSPHVPGNGAPRQSEPN